MRPAKQVKVTNGKNKGKVITVDGAGLILDDSPTCSRTSTYRSALDLRPERFGSRSLTSVRSRQLSLVSEEQATIRATQEAAST